MLSRCLARRATTTATAATIPPKYLPCSSITRGIHSSPKAPKPSPALLAGKQGEQQYLQQNLANLRAECRKRGLKVSGRKNELAGRLSAHDATSVSSKAHHSMAASRPVTLSSSRPPSNSFTSTTTDSGSSNVLKKVSKTPFSTSSARKAKGDNSTIDYFRFPEPPAFDVNPVPSVSIPVPPDAYGQTSSLASNIEEGRTESQIPLVHEISHQGKTSTIANKTQDSDKFLKSSADGTTQQGNEEFGGRDKTVLASLGLGAALWWGIGSLVSKKDDPHKH